MPHAHRFLVTGTDTDVGKTRVTAVLAQAMRLAGQQPTIVKLVQTGVDAHETGDALHAGELAHCAYAEFARFAKPADPWSAALAEGADLVRAANLACALERVPGAVVAEGAGGLAVPLNDTENFATVATLAHLEIVLTVGVRLGCMNHTLLTLALCRQLALGVAGCVLVDRWSNGDAGYLRDIARALQGKVEILGILPFETDERRAVESAAPLFLPFLSSRGTS